MSTPELHERPTLAPAVTAVLGRLRRRIRQYVWLEGCGAAVAWLAAAFWFTLVADWLFEPSVAMRGIALAAVAAVLAAVVVKLIARRAFVRITHSNLATVLERRFPQLNDSLLTAVVLGGRQISSRQSSRHTPCADMSAHGVCGLQDGIQDDDAVDRQMLAHTCRQAEARIADVDLDKVFNPRPLRLKCGAAAILTVSVALFALLFPEAFGVWTRRTLAMSHEFWPRNTRLEVEGFAGGVEKVARGADFPVVARADAAMPCVPQAVEVRYRFPGGGRGRAVMDRRGIARGPQDQFQEYAYTFRNLLADVHFDVVGGDDRVPDRWIQVVDSPTIARMTLECRLPPYIGRDQQALPVAGVMQVPMGSRVTVRAEAANKDLLRVEVHSVVDDRVSLERVLERADLAADGRGFSYPLAPLMKDTKLLFSLTDTDGVRGRDPLRLALVALPDQPPQVAVQLDGIEAAVTPQARIPAVGRVADDYGLDKAWFQYAVDQGEQRKHVIRKFSDRPTDLLLSDAVLELRELRLKPGQKLALSLGAADLCDLGRGPNQSASQRWVLDVVTPDQLRVMLQSRELLLRQRFERMIQEVTETRDILARLEFAPIKPRPAVVPAGGAASTPPSAVPSDGATDQPSVSAHRGFMGVQGALTNCRKGTQEVLGLAEAFDDIRKQLINNRIDTEELKNRLQAGIAEPLRRIADPMFPELEHRLEGLLKLLDDRQGSAESDPTHKAAIGDRARQQADEILVAMQKVLDRMIALEDFNEAVDVLRKIIASQKQLGAEAKQRKEQKIRELVEEPAAQQSHSEAEARPADKLASQQQQIAERYKQFEELLLRMGDLGAASDARRAALLKKTVARSKELLVALRLDQLAELIGKDQLSQALERHVEVDQDLQSLLELLLSENRAKRVADEKARLRQYLNRLNRIITQQKDVQGRTAGDGVPGTLSKEQSQITDKTGELRDDIAKNEEQKAEGGTGSARGTRRKAEGGKEGSGSSAPPPQDQSPHPARKPLEAARQRMKEAEANLQKARRNEAGQNQEEALRALHLAKAHLEQILRQLREEEIERTLADLEARFRKMLQMQEAVHEGTVRLDRVPLAQRTHDHEIEAGRLSGKESEIVVETDKALLLLRDDGSAVALLEAAGQVRDDAQQLVERLIQAKVDNLTQDIEEDVIAAMKEIIEALKKAQRDLQNKKQSPGQPPPSGEPRAPPLVDMLSELKMIRALQMRVNTRTARYSLMIEGEQATTAELSDALKGLAERQNRIHRVTRDLEMGKNQ